MTIPTATVELACVCLVIDLEGFRIPNEWVIRSIKVDGGFIDSYLWGRNTTFVVREMGWCPVETPSEGDAYPRTLKMGYVTVTSDRQQAEFPDNSVGRFQGRIPRGLDLRRGEWEVGLSSLFLPGPVHTVTPPSEARTTISHATVCAYGHQYGSLEPTGTYTRKRGTIATDWVGPVTTRTKGVDYIKAITDSVEQRLLQELPAGQTWMQHVTINGKTMERKAAITFHWEGEDLILVTERPY